MEKVKETAITILTTIITLGIVSFPVYLMYNWVIRTIFDWPYFDYLDVYAIIAFIILINSILVTSPKVFKD